MAVSRRRLLQSASLTGAGAAAAQQPGPAGTLDALRNVAAAHGIDLTGGRIERIQAAVHRRLSQLKALREFEIGGEVAPTPGILDR